jgi:hypothetical protein
VAENEKLVALMCLTEDQNLSRPPSVWTPHMQLAHRLLRAFDARVRTLDSHLRELTEHIDSTREVWHMQLDAMRNSIIKTNLHLQFAGVSTMAATLPGGATTCCKLCCWRVRVCSEGAVRPVLG